jgi:tetratricopeptide (TPR) repeat protein
MNRSTVPTVALVLSSLIVCSCSDRSIVKTVSVPSVSPSPSISTIDRQEADRYRQLGLQYRQQGNFAKSIIALEKAVRLNPNHLSGRVILGWTQHLAKQPRNAQKTLEKTLQIAPDHVPALNALGIVYLVGGNLSKAVATHCEAARLQPDNEIAYYNLSLAYHRLREFDRAMTNAQKAARLEPNNPHPLVALAMIYQDQGNTAQARKTYQRAIQLDDRYRQRGFLTHLASAGFSPEQIKRVEKLR